MKITLKKALKPSQKKKFICRDNVYTWEANYEKLIRDYVEAEFSYDEDARHNLIDGELISDIIFDDIWNMFMISDLGYINYITNYDTKTNGQHKVQLRNGINKAITKLCKENSFSKKKEAKQIEKEAKLEAKKQLPNKLFKYIQVEYGSDLEYNKTNGYVYYRGKRIIKNDIDLICLNIQNNEMFKNIKKSDITAIISEVAKLKQYEEKLNIDNNVDDTWNILLNVNEDNWEDMLQKDNKGHLIHSVFNYAAFFSFHPQFKDKIKYDSFSKIEYLTKYDKDYDCIVDKPIDDDLYNILKAQIERYFGDFNTKYMEAALSVTLENNSFHDIKRQFKEFERIGWDGKPRMHEIMIKYFGCEDREEIREMTEVMLCGSVQRILEERPDQGTMFDYMGVMFGKQGTGKTKFMTRLYLGDKYACLNPDINDDQKYTDLVNRAWLVLFDEMKSINKADMGTVKSRITEQGANVRLSYGRRSKYYPRHCSFWGNTNYTGVYRDEGEERRFLSFECLRTVIYENDWWEKNYTDYDIQQIWAETIQIYKSKWKGKVIEISKKTRDYNYMIQIRHKIWVDDGKTDLELKEILNFKQYNYPYYLPDQWRIWMKELDRLQLGESSTGSNTIDLINCKWMLARLPRRNDWINGMMEQNGWQRIEVDDEIFGKDEYYIRKGVTFDDIKTKYNEGFGEIDVEKLPF